MRICIVGWYFFENPKILEDFKKINLKYPVFIVSHRTSKEADEMLRASGLEYAITDNTGVEWGCYDWYLKNVWQNMPDGGHQEQMDSILFMHDDLEIEDHADFDRIAELECDQAYIFQDKTEDDINQHRHGRMIFLSGKILKRLLEKPCECEQYSFDHEDRWHNKEAYLPGCGPHSGFWYDRYNHGHIDGKPPLVYRINYFYKVEEQIENCLKHLDKEGISAEALLRDTKNNLNNLLNIFKANKGYQLQSVRHYNDGINHFDWQMGLLEKEGFKTKIRFYCPGLWLGRRNMFRQNKGDGYYTRKNN